MAFNQKLARMGQEIIDALDQYKIPYVVSYSATSDLQLTVSDPTGAAAYVQFIKAPQLGNNQANPVTGLVEEVFTPHIIQVAFDEAAKASDQIQFTAVTGGKQSIGDVSGLNVLATDSVVINGVTFTCVAGPVVANNQFLFSGTTDADTMANLAAAINASITAGVQDIYAEQNIGAPTQVDLRAKTPGVAGDLYTIADGGALKFTPSGATFTGGVDGDTITFVSPNGTNIFYALDNAQTQFLADNVFSFYVGASDAACAINAIDVINIYAQDFTAGPDPLIAEALMVYAVEGGANGNGLTDVCTGGITSAGVLSGGDDVSFDATARLKLTSECFKRGAQVDFFAPDFTGVASFAILGDNDYLTWSYRNLAWGNLSHM